MEGVWGYNNPKVNPSATPAPSSQSSLGHNQLQGPKRSGLGGWEHWMFGALSVDIRQQVQVSTYTYVFSPISILARTRSILTTELHSEPDFPF